jgi:NAD(P)-dependent dehydrogenase (short-subunit alcohol dehydrogenase family)
VNVADWEQQVKAFEAAISEFGRIDYVYPVAGVGERPWTPHHSDPKSGFVKPDLSVVDVDMRGVLYTCSLALQQFRRQEPDKNGFRGKSNARDLAPLSEWKS